MLIEMYVDELGSSFSTPESEYMEIENRLRRHIFGDMECRFKAGVTPSNISPSTCIYVIDFGALACYRSGSEWRADYLSRELIRAIEDHPDTCFFIWSSFTVKNYQYIAVEDKGLDCWDDYNKPKNIFLWDDYSSEKEEKIFDTVRKLLQLPEVPSQIKEFYMWKNLNNDLLPTDEEMD